MKPFTAALLAVGCSLSAHANDKHLPLPSQIMAAKSVYIENRSGQAALADRAYQELMAWGRFQVVQDRAGADLILLLSAHKEVGETRQTGRVDESGNINTTTRPLVREYSGLTVLDAKTGENLWTDSKATNIFQKSAIKRAIDELRKRIEEQTATSLSQQR
jgi:hypothetical protein